MNKMKKFLNIKAVFVLGLIIGLVSCTKDFEEMNVNPNEPNWAPNTNILAHSLRYYADNFFDAWQDMNNFMSYAGQVTKIQYVDESRYEYRASVVNTAWEDVYNTTLDLTKVIGYASESGDKNMQAAALTFRAYIMQIATDTWKSIPYSDAWKAEDGVVSPTYDSQENIYKAILDDLKMAGELFAADNHDALGDGDLLYGGDVAKWQKFCNSLRLRVAIRISNVNETLASTHIIEVLQGGKIMESNDDNAYFWWPGAAPYKEPWQEDSETRDDHGMCNTLVDTLIAFDDPRRHSIADTNAHGAYVGIPAGAKESSIPPLENISRPGAMYRQNPAGFTPFMRYAEVLFIKAEAAQRGFTNDDAKTLYEEGIRQSMYENGITDDEEINEYIESEKVAYTNDVKQIYLQKWICLFKDGHEAWAECRRTDIPLMGEAEGSPYGRHNRPPFRYPYPTNEFNRNGANIAPAAVGIVDQFWGQKMWWDTRTGVN